MGIVNTKGEVIIAENNSSRTSPLPECLKIEDFEKIVSTSVFDAKTEMETDIKALIEFRIWKQGRVNLESLVQKLRSAVRHAIWDLVTEYHFLPTLLTVPLKENSFENTDDSPNRQITESKIKTPETKISKTKTIVTDKSDENQKIISNPVKSTNQNIEIEKSQNDHDQPKKINLVEINETENEIKIHETGKISSEEKNIETANTLNMKNYEMGEKGKLHKMYYVTLPFWFQFALEINVPAVKKHIVTLDRRHSLAVALRELQNIIYNNASDTVTRTFVQSSRQPFINDDMEEDPLAFKILEGADNINSAWLKNAQEKESNDESLYLPCDFSKEEQGIYVKSILIARNFQQWKASFAQTIEPEKLVPKGKLKKNKW